MSHACGLSRTTGAAIWDRERLEAFVGHFDESWGDAAEQGLAVCCGVLRCVAVCCSVLQCVAGRVALSCSVLQCVAVRVTRR